MPILKICTGPGQLEAAQLASAAVRATMLFPNDEARRERFQAVEAIGLYKQNEPPEVIPWAIANALHDAALDRHFDREVAKRQRSGEVAGLLYRAFLQLMIHHPEYGSFNSALAVTGPIIERTKARGNEPRERASSPSTIKQSWSRHKTVAHLWTAARLDQENQHQDGWDDWHTSNAGLLRMLALSEALRTLGENHFAHGQTASSLDPSETWCPPETLVLPNITALIPPIEPEILDIIAKDRAGRRTLTH